MISLAFGNSAALSRMCRTAIADGRRRPGGTMAARSRTPRGSWRIDTRRIGILLAALVASAVASPAGATPPTIQHFTAMLSDLNLITLDWQVSGGDSSNLLYIYDDVGFR